MRVIPCPFTGCLRVLDGSRGLGIHCARTHPGQAIPAEGHRSTLHEQLFWDGCDARMRELNAVGGQEAAAPRQFLLEPYPDAAWPCNDHGERLAQYKAPPSPIFALKQPADPLYPFDTVSQFRWTRTAVKCSEAATEDILKNLEQDGLEQPFRNKPDAMKAVDRIPYGKSWNPFRKVTLTLDLVGSGLVDLVGVDGFEYITERVTVYMRDTRAVLEHLLSNPAFASHQSLVPTKVYDTERGRWISEPFTADGAWEFQETLPAGWCGVRVDLASDSTLCSTGTGGAAEHPVYLSTPCNAAHLRRGDYGANIVVCFLPAFKRSGHGEDEYFRSYKRIVRHAAMRLLLEPLRLLLEDGALLRYADGHFRHSRVFFGPHSADYPEQCWTHSMVEGWCTTCDSRPTDLLNIDEPVGGLRSGEKSEAIRRAARELDGVHAQRKYAKERGLHLERPWYTAFGIDGHQLNTADPLHQVLNGTIKQLTLDRLVLPYLLKITGGGRREANLLSRLSKHLSLMPVFPNLRRFANGITFKQWTGENTLALVVYISAALFNLTGEDVNHERATVVDEIPEVFALLAIFALLARSYESTEASRYTQQQAYRRFIALIREPDLFDFQTTFRWPRMHALLHYEYYALQQGTPPNHDTSTSERLHKKVVKDPYRRSNHLHPTQQILTTNMRQDALAAYACVTSLTGHLGPGLATFASDPPLEHPSATIVMPVRGNRYNRRRIRLVKLGQVEGFPDLSALVMSFLRQHYKVEMNLEASGGLGAYVFKSVRAEFPTYPAAPFYNHDTCRVDSHHIYATDTYFSRSTNTRILRYDAVLLRNFRQPVNAGYRAFDVARVRLFFSVPLQGREVQLALVEDYEKERGGRPLLPLRQPTVKLAVEPTGKIKRRIVRVADIYRSVLLLPLFQDAELAPDLTFSNILSRWGEAGGSFAVSLFSDLAIFNLLGPSLMC